MICFPSIVRLCKIGPKDIWSISKPYIVSTQSFHSKKQKLNHFILSVAWPRVGRRFGWGTKAEGLGH